MFLIQPHKPERIRNTGALRQKFLRETEQYLAGELRAASAARLTPNYRPIRRRRFIAC